MSVLTQNLPNVAFIISEANGHRSRDNINLAFGQAAIAAGTVLMSGDVDFTDRTADVTDTSTALENLSSVADLIDGVTYSVTGTGIPANTTFKYNADTGVASQVMSHAATGTHATETVTIARASGGAIPWATGGTPIGLNLYRKNPAADVADVPVSAITRDAEVNVHMIIFPTDTDAEVIAALADIGVIAR